MTKITGDPAVVSAALSLDNVPSQLPDLHTHPNDSTEAEAGSDSPCSADASPPLSPLGSGLSQTDDSETESASASPFQLGLLAVAVATPPLCPTPPPQAALSHGELAAQRTDSESNSDPSAYSASGPEA